MSRLINATERHRRRQAGESPSERVVFLAGVLAAVIVGLMIAFFHAG